MRWVEKRTETPTHPVVDNLLFSAAKTVFFTVVFPGLTLQVIQCSEAQYAWKKYFNICNYHSIGGPGKKWPNWKIYLAWL